MLLLASWSSVTKNVGNIKYKTFFGNCPSRSVGTVTLGLVKEFEKKQSLRDIKAMIVENKLQEKYFFVDYRIKYDYFNKELHFSYICPKALLKVQIYNSKYEDNYQAVLVQNGKLFDPTYEVLLKEEGKIDHDLPLLALPNGSLDPKMLKRISTLMEKVKAGYYRKISELIINKDEGLTMILSVKNSPSSIFFGKKDWVKKLVKLQKIISYMEAKSKIPSIINLTNDKKIVVKFIE